MIDFIPIKIKVTGDTEIPGASVFVHPVSRDENGDLVMQFDVREQLSDADIEAYAVEDVFKLE